MSDPAVEYGAGRCPRYVIQTGRLLVERVIRGLRVASLCRGTASANPQ